MATLTVEELLSGVLPMGETTDMTLMARIPLIVRNSRKDAAEFLLSTTKLWYHNKMNQTGQVFWSENHFIMNSSAELILREFLGVEVSQDLRKRVETFLELKARLGVAEFLSPVYMPFTIAALLNLYDYTTTSIIKSLSQSALDRIAEQVLSVSLLDGSIISPSGRAYARHREVTKGLHLSHFLTFLITKTNVTNNPGDPEQALRTTLSTTTWRPSDYVYANFVVGPKDFEVQLTPRWEDLLQFLDSRNLSPDLYVTMLWSHGAYVPPHYKSIVKVLDFMDTQNLWGHPFFKAIRYGRKAIWFIFKSILATVILAVVSMWAVNSYALGGLLTDCRVRVHREGTVLLSSLVGYNVGLPSFQQWPWAVNLNGIPIWCGFGGSGSAGLSSLGNKHAASELSSAKVIPYMYQEGHRLVARYRAKEVLLRWANRFDKPKMRWPTSDFDEYGKRQMDGTTWRWARKGNAVVAFRIISLEVHVVVRDLAVSSTTLSSFLDTELSAFNI